MNVYVFYLKNKLQNKDCLVFPLKEKSNYISIIVRFVKNRIEFDQIF